MNDMVVSSFWLLRIKLLRTSFFTKISWLASYTPNSCNSTKAAQACTAELLCTAGPPTHLGSALSMGWVLRTPYAEAKALLRRHGTLLVWGPAETSTQSIMMVYCGKGCDTRGVWRGGCVGLPWIGRLGRTQGGMCKLRIGG